ncbi:hypothetical protein [Aureibaculum conchae]|uniref:hypothetical protein n=1 Tax=Aureibaculum sp. 2308TA14-22 TaxID=3108392 RepID=UPI003391E88B
MKKVLILFFTLLIQQSFSQKKFSIEVLSGFGYNKELTLVNEEVDNDNVTTFQLNANYNFKVFKKVFVETGVGAQWFFSSGGVRVSQFKTTSLRLKIPVLIGYNLFKKTNVYTGVALFNNRDLNTFDSKKNFNFRTSLLVKGSYSIKNNLDIIFLLQKNLSRIPDLYFLNQPYIDISAGISYKLF